MAPRVKKSKFIRKKRRSTKKPKNQNINKINISVGGASGGGGGGGAGGVSAALSHQSPSQPQLARELFSRPEVRNTYPPQYVKPGWDHLPADDTMSGFKSTYHHTPSLAATATGDDLASAISRGKSRATMSLADDDIKSKASSHKSKASTKMLMDDDTISLPSVKAEPVAVKPEPIAIKAEDPFGRSVVKHERSIVDLTAPLPPWDFPQFKSIVPGKEFTAMTPTALIVYPPADAPKEKAVKKARNVKPEFRMAKGIRNSTADLTDDGVQEVMQIAKPPAVIHDLLLEEDNPARYDSSKFAPAPETIDTGLGFGDTKPSRHKVQSAELFPDHNVASKVAAIESKLIVPEKSRKVITQYNNVTRGSNDAPAVDRMLASAGGSGMKFSGVDPFEKSNPPLKMQRALEAGATIIDPIMFEAI